MHLIPKLSINDIAPEQWPEVDNPLNKHAFLSLFEETLVVAAEKGWQPLHFCFYQDESEEKLLAIIPGYVKSHSYGEYVFDWAWANAYEQSGLDYYPKLLNATPLTPCLADKIIGHLSEAELTKTISLIKQWIGDNNFSGWHINFNTEEQASQLRQQQLWHRQDIQFHWNNHQYEGFSDFLSKLKPKKRRNIVQERRKVKEAGWSFEKVLAKEVSKEQWQLFYDLYSKTFAEKGGWAQLNLPFFQGLSASLPEEALVIFASSEGSIKAASLFFISKTHLYGRYWGALEYSPALHFECAYYQGIEYAIENNIETFEPGAQGEHKLARGFEATITDSFHYLIDKGFNPSIEQWIEQEKNHLSERFKYYKEHSAYREN